MAKKIPYGLTDYVLLMTDINMHQMKRYRAVQVTPVCVSLPQFTEAGNR